MAATTTRSRLPPLDFEYSQPTIEPTVHTVDPKSLANLPEGIDGKGYQLLDLDGEGLPGVLTQQAGAFFYKRNLGDGQFAPLARIATQPSMADLGGGVQQLSDLDGSGAKCLVQLGRKPEGYFVRRDGGWRAVPPVSVAAERRLVEPGPEAPRPRRRRAARSCSSPRVSSSAGGPPEAATATAPSAA